MIEQAGDTGDARELRDAAGFETRATARPSPRECMLPMDRR